MIKTAIATLCLVCTFGPRLFSQDADPTRDAIQEALVRQAAKIDLHKRLGEAQAAERRGQLQDAAKLYEDCLSLLKKVGVGAEQEAGSVLTGFAHVRLLLADQSMRRMDFTDAEHQITRVLNEDPKNPQALALKAKLAKARAESEGLMPSNEALAKIPEAHQQRVQASTLVQDAKLFLESGRYQEAEARLNQARKLDPDNQAAYYYLNLLAQQQHQQENHSREYWSTKSLLAVDEKWSEEYDKQILPVPNPYVNTNLVHTSKARQNIYLKLDRIRLEQVAWDGLPLNEVIKQLMDEAKRRDPDKKGLNFIINSYADPVNAGPPAVDPATGLPVANASDSGDVGTAIIKLSLHDVTLHNVLDAISKVADHPIKYSVEDYAIVFTPKGPETPTLHTRWFKVDPNTFLQGMQGVAAFSFGSQGQNQGGGGGGGGGRGGGGGGRGGGGGGGRGNQGGNQGGQGGQNGQDQSGSEYVGVRLVGGIGQQGRAGGAAGGAGQAGRPGQPGQAGGGQGAQGGVDFLTYQTSVDQVFTTVVNFFRTAGVDLSPPKNVFYNDRLGMLMVRATLQDLDTVEQAIQVLNMSPPQMTIEAKFAEVTQDDNRSLGFDWYLGNLLMAGGRIGGQAGTAPTFAGVPTAANPNGFFPGPSGFVGAGALPPAATDNLLTSGLRNDAPALATFTGILTDPQFRMVIKALDQRQGVDLLSAPKITTLSSRQAQIKAVDIRSIVTDLDLDQTASGGGGGGVIAGNTGGGVVASTIQPIVEQIELGPVLDVLPVVSADGYTVQMTIIPTIKEFVGYDLDTAKLFQAQAQSVGGVVPGNPLTTTTPLPIFRLRQVVTSVSVWDGQTVVLGGLISENVTRTKDKVPILGDLPLAGRFFRTESSQTKKKNLLIFVTPTIIDPAGNRVHTPEDMPFAQNAIPVQKPVTQ